MMSRYVVSCVCVMYVRVYVSVMCVCDECVHVCHECVYGVGGISINMIISMSMNIEANKHISMGI